MPVTCGFTSCWYPLKGISAGQIMIICVRGAIAPKSQCALTGEFTLGGTQLHSHSSDAPGCW